MLRNTSSRQNNILQLSHLTVSGADPPSDRGGADLLLRRRGDALREGRLRHPIRPCTRQAPGEPSSSPSSKPWRSSRKFLLLVGYLIYHLGHLQVVKKSLVTFVNKHLNKINLEVTELESQFSDGVSFIK